LYLSRKSLTFTLSLHTQNYNANYFLNNYPNLSTATNLSQICVICHFCITEHNYTTKASKEWQAAEIGAVLYTRHQSQSINKVPTRFDVYIKGNRNDFFATRGADIAILTNILKFLTISAKFELSN
jgi:hypothetical protein